MRESPSVELMERLRDMGADLAYSDPHVAVFPKMREHRFELKSTPLSAATLSSFDAVLLATNHDKFDYPLIKQHAKLIIDTRGVYRKPAPNVVKA
jgi:UDP-N-acetyl-D-glucosamine dehydrogenase